MLFVRHFLIVVTSVLSSTSNARILSKKGEILQKGGCFENNAKNSNRRQPLRVPQHDAHVYSACTA
jgi:hypothetical protein